MSEDILLLEAVVARRTIEERASKLQKLREQQLLQQKHEERREQQFKPHVIDREPPKFTGIRIEGVACAEQCQRDIVNFLEGNYSEVHGEIKRRDALREISDLEEKVLNVAAKIGVVAKLKESEKPGGVEYNVKYDWCPTEKRWKPGCSEENCPTCYKGVVIQPPLIFRQV